MDLFTNDQIEAFSQQHFAFLKVEKGNHILSLVLNRPAKKNALHPQMVNEIAYCMQYAHQSHEIWVIVIGAEGNVFCAGADLKAMAGIIEENDSTIPHPQQEILIGELFNKVYKPTIAKVTGDVYAGGFFFLAGCNIVLAQDDITLGLPEVKRGLYPFQVMAALLKVMPPRKVIDWCIRGYNLPVEEAEKYGLVSQTVMASEMEEAVTSVIDELKSNSPSAISLGLQAYDQIQPSAQAHKYLREMLMKTIATQDGQEGLKAFREKRKPEWKGQ